MKCIRIRSRYNYWAEGCARMAGNLIYNPPNNFADVLRQRATPERSFLFCSLRYPDRNKICISYIPDSLRQIRPILAYWSAADFKTAPPCPRSSAFNPNSVQNDSLPVQAEKSSSCEPFIQTTALYSLPAIVLRRCPDDVRTMNQGFRIPFFNQRSRKPFERHAYGKNSSSHQHSKTRRSVLISGPGFKPSHL